MVDSEIENLVEAVSVVEKVEIEVDLADVEKVEIEVDLVVQKCIRQFVLNAEMTAKYLSNHLVKDLCFAALVSETKMLVHQDNHFLEIEMLAEISQNLTLTVKDLSVLSDLIVLKNSLRL